jgi:hypothetical protein
MNDDDFATPARVRSGNGLAATRPGQASSRAPSRKPSRATGISGLMGRILARMARRPMRTMFHAGMLGVGIVIALNALMFQTKRHPAPWGLAGHGQTPLQGQDTATPLPPSRPVALSAVQASPAFTTQKTQAVAAAAPAVREAQKEVTGRLPYAASGLQAPPVPPGLVKQASAERARDPIGDLIRGGDPAAPTLADRSANEPARPVAAAQRALIKLGYGLPKADGVNGAATRTAIERFEKDRRLPVTGELNARTLRELGAASGQKFD